ncbi:hypothetical protein C0989_001160 [Termitomyces sp. Mn162]|nr:hypothetical protein C0989_001160 [Termitomyces sp. Mn162]
MNADAQEAAMGLLSLSPTNVGVKRKAVRKRGKKEAETEEAIRCICGSTYDDGFSIACDDCERWCHAACFGIDPGHVPEEWKCWLCDPRPSKKRRRLSVPPSPPPDVVIEIESPPATYIPLAPHANIVPAAQTRSHLRRAAQHWRGISALTPYARDGIHDANTHDRPTHVHRHPAPAPSLASPPFFALHTTAPLPKEALITPLTSTITPSSAYLNDPLNAYAHLGLPKPFVHLLGPPLHLALDARMAGDDARWVRSGCRPNAVLRPVICNPADQPTTLGFAVFALRDLQKGEEVVLGWEWDDGHAIHLLPALLKTPGLFPCVPCLPRPFRLLTHHRPAHHAHLRAQMANILHLLTSTFPACACGAHASDCALRAMESFVRASSPDHSHDPPTDSERRIHHRRDVDLGPLVGSKRGFRTRERVPGSGGLGGVEICDDTPEEDDRGEGPSRITLDVIGKTRGARGGAWDPYGYESERWHGHERGHQHQRGTRLRTPEEKMPPKMRKRWMRREGEALRRAEGGKQSTLCAWAWGWQRRWYVLFFVMQRRGV